MATYGTAIINGDAVRFAVALRDGNPTPVALELTVHLPVSLEDIAAALWFVACGVDAEDWEDDEYLRSLALDTIVANCAADIVDAQITMEGVRPGSEEFELAQLIRRRVAELFGPTAPRQRGRELAGVAS